MPTETLKRSPVAALAAMPASQRLVAVNLAASAIGASVLLTVGAQEALGFLTGCLIGGLNLLWMARIARRGLGMEAHRAARYVAMRYYLRFVLTAGVLALLIKEGYVAPWPPAAGLTTIIFATVGVLIFSLKEEAK